MTAVIPDVVPDGAWGTTPATTNVNMNGKAITGASTIDASGQIAGGSLLANGNVKISGDAWGARLLTTSIANLGLGTSGLSNSIQIGATGNVGLLKSASVALDVEGQNACSGMLIIGDDATTRAVFPLADNAYDCGLPTNRWAGTYTQALDVAGMVTARTPVLLMLTGSPTIYLANGTTTPTTAPVSNYSLFFRYPTVSVNKNWGTVSYANTYGLKVPYEGL
jgi:hypothetical protein